jgi:seryl-tRNA synthetase
MNSRTSFRWLTLCALAAALPAAQADQSDRERAQLLQLQQQLQRLQSDSAQAQKERNELQGRAQHAEDLQKKGEQELARARAAAAARDKDLAATKADLDAANSKIAALQVRVEGLQKDVAQRNDALAHAAADKRSTETQIALLSTRLKLNTGRADLCETRHASLMQVATGLVDRYEGDRLRWCEPITGIWRVREEIQVQQMRETLYGLRLDVPAPPAPAASTAAAPAQGGASDPVR